MSGAGVIGVILGVPAAIVVIIVLIAIVFGGHRSSDEVRRWAEQNGWQYVARDPALSNRWSGEPFLRGTEDWVEDALYGTVDGRQAVWFTYRWKTQQQDLNGTSVMWHTRQVMALTLPASLPGLLLVPETLSSKLKGAFGMRDLQIGVREFDKRWQIHAEDEQLARRLLSQPAMQAFLMEQGTYRSFRIVEDTILLWRDGGAKPEDLAQFRARLTGFVQLVPADVWAGYAGRRLSYGSIDLRPTSVPGEPAPGQPGQARSAPPSADQAPVELAPGQPGQWWSAQPPADQAPTGEGMRRSPAEQPGPQWLGTPGGPVHEGRVRRS